MSSTSSLQHQAAQQQTFSFEEADFSSFLSRYEGFGSFFSADVEVLIRQDEEEYVCTPSFPAFATLSRALAETGGERYQHLRDTRIRGTANNNTTTDDHNNDNAGSEAVHGTPTNEVARLPPPPAFGHAFRDTFFAIDKSFTFVNHGAFGGALAFGSHLKQQFESHMESQLLTFMDRQALPWAAHSTRLVAKHVLKCRPTDLVLVPNATYAINAAIAALITFGDVVVFFDTEYLAVFKMLQERCDALLAASIKSGGALPPASLKELPLDGLLLDEGLMGCDEKLAEHIASQLPLETTVVVMDLITSTASLHFPIFTHIIPALKRRLPHLRHTIVDGAHGPLQCEVALNSLAPEQLPSVYVGNLHKWFSAPKSVGVLWVREDVQDQMRPLIVSHGARNGFLSDFIWDGTRDLGALLALPSIIAFWYDYIGVDKVRAYCETLKRDAVAMLTSAWSSEVAAVPRSAPFMGLVMLPPFFQRHSRFITAKYVQDALYHQHKIEVPVKIIRGRLYLRVSFFVNNEMADYYTLRDAVLAIRDSIVAQLVAAREARLLAATPTATTPYIGSEDATTPVLGAKRSRSPTDSAAASQPHHQPHHDKSQIVKPTTPVLNPSAAPEAATVAPPSMSAADTVPPYSAAVLDVPQTCGGSQLVVLTSLSHKNRSTTAANHDSNGPSSYSSSLRMTIDTLANFLGGATNPRSSDDDDTPQAPPHHQGASSSTAPLPPLPAPQITTVITAGVGKALGIAVQRGPTISGVASSSTGPSSPIISVDAADGSTTSSTTSNSGGVGAAGNGVAPAAAAAGGAVASDATAAASKDPAPAAAPPQTNTATVAPDCNGCGLGALGAMPKKTRKF